MAICLKGIQHVLEVLTEGRFETHHRAGQAERPTHNVPQNHQGMCLNYFSNDYESDDKLYDAGARSRTQGRVCDGVKVDNDTDNIKLTIPTFQGSLDPNIYLE
ncbi:hypothetical protein ACH5RR_029590 [Cinchona calisaya]|uniref:Uncharacterized protein n=1 Tax=Cinchona calisaya TaxID=153742 RepID=A0ABD2YVE1_9GENT